MKLEQFVLLPEQTLPFKEPPLPADLALSWSGMQPVYHWIPTTYQQYYLYTVTGNEREKTGLFLPPAASLVLKKHDS